MYNLTMLQWMMGLGLILAFTAKAEPTWQEGEPIAEDGRANPYDWPENQLAQAIERGQLHAFTYPVRITGTLVPYEAARRFLDEPSPNLLRGLLQDISRTFSHFRSLRDAMDWLGLHRFPGDAGQPGGLPLPPGLKPGDAMGLSLLPLKEGTAFTFSCAACHVGQLFGRPILGLTNRFSRANVLFSRGKLVTSLVSSPLFSWALASTEGEREMYARTRHNLRFVASKDPETLGLDTSLAHVALSLARRADDPEASKILSRAIAPRFEPLASSPADSKPAVWWNLKYKNRWLSDGSVLSGNPIITNLLWNEIGRGTDLRELSRWLDDNPNTIRDLTTAVFASSAPAISDFFPAERIDLAAAKRGQALFQRYCSQCHGRYVKGWERDELPPGDWLKTIKVIYHRTTPVIDVGTDSHRRAGMRSLVQLNDLSLSREHGVKVAAQSGYVPPPLVGIWARWPYFHNNSAPSLCAVLTPSNNRPLTYWAGEPLDRERDFDFDCNGYPSAERVPPHWKSSSAYFFDTSRPGLSASGHDIGIFMSGENEWLSHNDKRDLIRFLQTL